MNKKGFTLIELLAVIVILAIIALIAVPIILNIISDSKKQSSERSAELYLKAAELAIARKNLTTELGDTTCEVQSQNDSENSLEIGDLMCDTTPVKVEMDGTKPNGGNIVFTNGKVTSVTELSFSNGDSYNLENGKLVLSTPKESTSDTCFEYENYIPKEAYTINTQNCQSVVASIFYDMGAPEGFAETEEGASGINSVCAGSDEFEITMDYLVNNDDTRKKLIDGNALVIDMSSVGSIVTGYTCDYKDVIIPNKLDGKKVIEISDNVFLQKGLTSVTIPNTVTTIGDYAFALNQLESVILPNNLKTIGESAFAGNQLKTVIFGNSVTTIGDSAFTANQLTEVTIPNSVKIIDEDAFRYNRLTKLTLGNSVTTIGTSAFYGNQLTSITIPNSVTTIENSAFADGTGTSDINNLVYGPNVLTSVTIDKCQNNPDLTISSSAFEGYDNSQIQWRTTGCE